MKLTKDQIHDAMVQCCETYRYEIWPEAMDRLADAVLAASASTMDAIAWKTTHKAVCVPITEDRAVAEMWRANGYEVIALGRAGAGELLDAAPKPVPYHSFEKCAEEVWRDLADASSRQEPVACTTETDLAFVEKGELSTMFPVGTSNASVNLYTHPSAEIAALRELLSELAALRRYDPNNGKRKEPYPARNLTLNVPAELLDRIDELCAGRPKQPKGHFLPAELTPPVRRILGMMLWETGPIAGALRAAGKQINNRAEDEQATVLHWLLGFALEHGMDWHKPAAAALHKMTQAIKD